MPTGVQRLSRKSDIHRTLREGGRFHSSLFVLRLRKRASGEGPSSSPRLAVGTAGRFPTAVARNRARRRLRASCREAMGDSRRPWDLVLMARPRMLQASFQDLLAALRDALRQAGGFVQGLAVRV